MKPIVHHTTCRACGHTLFPLWDLGDQHIVGFPAPGEDRPIAAPLCLSICASPDCRLVQLADTVPPAALFTDYWYRSGTNESMVLALDDIVRQATVRRPVGRGDAVLDIGANDGTLLSHYERICGEDACPMRVAVDPAVTIRGALRQNCEVLVPRFFPDPEARATVGSFKIITAIAMAYDLEDPHAFFAEIARILHQEGLFVLQVGYLGALLSRNAFDSICHEHLEYYSLTSLVHLLGKHGLVVEDVAFNEVNGGSIRCYIRHATTYDERWQWRISHVLGQEALDGLSSPERYKWLRERVDRCKTQVVSAVAAATQAGAAVDVYGASTKGLTLLQYFGLAAPALRVAVDRNPDKFGRHYGATGVPIVGEETWRSLSKPAFAIVLPWHFRKGIVEREAPRPEQTLRVPLYFPLPNPEMVTVRPPEFQEVEEAAR